MHWGVELRRKMLCRKIRDGQAWIGIGVNGQIVPGSLALRPATFMVTVACLHKEVENTSGDMFFQFLLKSIRVGIQLI